MLWVLVGKGSSGVCIVGYSVEDFFWGVSCGLEWERVLLRCVLWVIVWRVSSGVCVLGCSVERFVCLYGGCTHLFLVCVCAWVVVVELFISFIE